MECNAGLKSPALRLGTHDDDAECARLWSRTVAARDDLVSSDETELRANRKLAVNRISLLVASDSEGLIVAFSLLHGDEQDAGTWTAHLSMLAVQPKMQSFGLGKRLLNATHELATVEGFAALTLRVLTSSTRARRLYESAGWFSTGDGRFQDSDREFTSYRRLLDDH